MNLVKRDEFDALKKMVQKLIIEEENIKKPRNSKKKSSEKFTILIAEFYSKDSALILKRRITQERYR